MRRRNGMIEVMVAMRVRDIVAVIERDYGGVKKLRKYVDSHPNDKTALLLWDTVDRHGDEPDLEVKLGQILFGDPAEILAVAKLELIGHLMGRPAMGVRELARSLKKNPATVLEQVSHLEKMGLVLKESAGRGKPTLIRPLVTEVTIRVSTAEA